MAKKGKGSKRPRAAKDAAEDEAQPAPEAAVVLLSASEVASVEEAILADVAACNGIVDLVHTAFSGPQEKAEESRAAIGALCRVFAKLQPSQYTRTTAAGERALKEYQKWIREQYNSTVRCLLGRIRTADPSLAEASLHAIMDLVVAEGEYQSRVQQSPQFSALLLSRLLMALVDGSHDREELVGVFVEEYLAYDDVRHYALNALPRVLSQLAEQDRVAQRKKGRKIAADEAHLSPVVLLMITNAYAIVHEADVPAADGETGGNFIVEGPVSGEHPLMRAAPHRKSYSEALLSLLDYQLPDDVFKDILLNMNDVIIPNLVNPKMLMDFLTDTYDHGSGMALLALHGLFTLMQKYDLDYPDFFRKLYNMFTTDLFYARYRSKFFRLTDKFFLSMHMPLYLVAAFVKKLARLSLSAPPAGAVVILRFIYNLLKRHPKALVLIHRAMDVAETGVVQSYESDPFLAEENDPAKSKALESCVWEVRALMDHYHPTVARAARALEIPKLGKAEMSIEAVMKSSYASLFEADLQDKHKAECSVTFQPPAQLFVGEAFTEAWTTTPRPEG